MLIPHIIASVVIGGSIPSLASTLSNPFCGGGVWGGRSKLSKLEPGDHVIPSFFVWADE